MIYLSKPGLVCCAASDNGAFYEAALRGDRSGIVPVRVNTAGQEKNFLAGRVRDIPPSGSSFPSGSFPPGSRLLGLCAAALEQIRPGVEKALDRWGPERIGVCAGSCDNGTEWSIPAHRTFFETGAFPKNYALRLQGAAGPAEYAAAFFGLKGPALALATACASGATAIIRGAELIRGGICDAVIAGGADIASDTVLLGFAALEAVSGEPSNPFSKNRRGINLGEGAAFFILSREKPEEPGIPSSNNGILLAGWGESADAHHITAPHPEGTGAAAAMNAALSGAALNPDDISYVNLHGTGTPLNDRAEALAMEAVFGKNQPPASSSKPVTGHTLGAAGALELALCREALKNAGSPVALPLHCWDGVRDESIPALRLNDGASALAPNEKIRYCMSNSFAFGGCNVSLILGREDDVHG
jgi:3-oxoacyl-[acyl-carrier-protein] synthase-1